MKKQSVLRLLFLLPALAAFFVCYAHKPESTSPNNNDPLDCPLPPPAWLIVTNLTPTSVSLEWEPPSAFTFFKVEGYDLTTSTALTTYYTTANVQTYNGLTPNHNYRFSVSGSACQNGPYGDTISLERRTPQIIIIEKIVGFQNACSPSSTPTPPSLNTPYVFCVDESGTDGIPLSNGVIGRVGYNDDEFHFGMGGMGTTLHIGYAFSVSNTFHITQVSSSHAACYYNNGSGNVELFTISYLNGGTVSSPWITTRIVFGTNCQSFTFCNNTCPENRFLVTEDDVEANYMDESGQEIILADQSPTDVPVRVAPNPFGRLTTLTYELTEPEATEISLYDPTGRLVTSLGNMEQQAPGQYEISIDGSSLPNGVYFLQVQTAGKREVFHLVKQE